MTPGQIAFEAYRAIKPVAFNGDPVPDWDHIQGDKEATHAAWEEAASAVVLDYLKTRKQ